jgi:hypothetical protein
MSAETSVGECTEANQEQSDLGILPWRSMGHENANLLASSYVLYAAAAMGSAAIVAGTITISQISTPHEPAAA